MLYVQLPYITKCLQTDVVPPKMASYAPYKDRNGKNRYRTHTLSKRTLLFPLYQPRRERGNPLFYWVKCTSLFLAIEERESENLCISAKHPTPANAKQRGLFLNHHPKNTPIYWAFYKNKKSRSSSDSLFALPPWRRGRDSNPRTLAGQRFSRPPLSTTQPPLQKYDDIISYYSQLRHTRYHRRDPNSAK